MLQVYDDLFNPSREDNIKISYTYIINLGIVLYYKSYLCFASLRINDLVLIYA